MSKKANLKVFLNYKHVVLDKTFILYICEGILSRFLKKRAS